MTDDGCIGLGGISMWMAAWTLPFFSLVQHSFHVYSVDFAVIYNCTIVIAL